MLGFTLSKLNLLILVTAMFAIISFFLFSLTNIVVSNLAQQMTNEYSGTIFGLVQGGTLCRTSSVTVPESIEYFGGLGPTKRFYYVMYIVKKDPKTDQQLSSLILRIAERSDQDHIIAASSIDLNAEILLYEWDSKTDLLTEQGQIAIDPESAGVATKNSFKIVKEVYLGKNYLHIIACSSSAGMCEVNLTRAACMVCQNQGRASTCFPKPEECPGGEEC